MKNIMKVIAAFILLGVLCVACNSYVCPAYRAKVQNSEQSNKHS